MTYAGGAPTAGTAVGIVRSAQVFIPGAASVMPNIITWTFGIGGAGALVLRGVAQQLCVNLPAIIATQTMSVTFEWTEE